MNEKSVPRHIVFIPDGNRRWAKARGVPVLEGHRVGLDNLRMVMAWCRDAGVRTVTFWGFSLDNFGRGEGEVKPLMGLFVLKFNEFKERAALHENRIRVRFFGRLDRLPKALQEKLAEVERDTAGYDGYFVNILLAYGGRQEIVDACNAAIADAKAGKLERVDEETLGAYFALNGQPEPDLIIRTSGEQRTSGVLPWNAGYSELYFSQKLWPDFGKDDLQAALDDYASRKRRFGK